MNSVPPAQPWLETRSACPYCGTGCGVIIRHDGARIRDVRGDPAHPANFGRLCTKGRVLHQTVHSPDRLRQPLLRRRGQDLDQIITWDAALDLAAQRFARIIAAHGPDAVAFYVSGQLSTEDYYVVNKLAKGLIGTNNIDTNSRLCMASAVSGYKASLGMDSMPCSYEDIEHADCIFIIGANPAFAHPILFRRIEDAKAKNPDLKLIVADPRRTASAALADLHLPLLPGTDVALLHGMLHVLIWEDLIDRDFIHAHTEGWAALKDLAQEYTPARVAGICQLPEAEIRLAARYFGQARAALSLWCQGLNQSAHGTDKNMALINLHLATGQIGKPGAGPLSLTGQPNAMGGREVGGMPSLLPGHREVENPRDRDEIARLWGVETLPATPGLSAVPLFQALKSGQVKAVWIACTNPVVSLPHQAEVIAALEHAEFVVHQDAYHPTETARYADLVLPAASWGEREALVTNSERRITRLRQAVPPPGEARPDWVIFRDFALALGQALETAGVAAPAGKPFAARAQRLFDYPDNAAVFAEFRACTRGRDLDIGGLSLEILDQDGPQQWPFPAGATRGQARLYADGVFPTPSGKARFQAPAYAPVAEEIDARYPLRLTNGRLRDQWHTLARSGKAAQLFNHAPEPLLDLHPLNAQHLGLVTGQIARITSRRGTALARVNVSTDVRPGTTFLPMHFGALHAPQGGANRLTLAALDPVSKQPEFKHSAVRVEAAHFPWQASVLRRLDDPEFFHKAQRLAGRFAFATLSRLGTDGVDALLLRLAHDHAPMPDTLPLLDRLLGLDQDNALDYQDSRRGIAKRVVLQGGRLLGARLVGEDATLPWLRSLLLEQADVQPFRHLLLASQIPQQLGQVATTSRLLCNCMGVSEARIIEAIAQGAMTVDGVGSACGAGTQCGSCKPEIHQLLRTRTDAGARAEARGSA